MDEQSSEPVKKQEEAVPKKSKWPFLFGSCLGLVILFFIGIFVLKSIGLDSLKNSVGSKEGEKTSSKGIKPYSAMSHDELVDYFVTVTTEYGSNKVKVSRWGKDIKVQIKGNAEQEYLELIDQFIEKFNKNSNSIKMKKVTTGGNYTVEFGNTASGLPGGAAFSSGSDCLIDGAVVTVGPEANMVETLSNYTVNHEMFHALGFSGHYRSENTCTMMSANHCGESYTENEEKLIQMLYNSGVSVCTDESQIRTFFK